MNEPAYSFLGFPVSAHDAAKFVDRLVLRDERDGSLVVRLRTELLRTTRKAAA